MRTIAIIPARGGSKGIPGKNIIDFCGHPLLAWTIAAARRSEFLHGVYVSTDDDAIASVSRSYGAQVVARPADLAGDTATSESALTHVLDVLAASNEDEPECVLFLQPTSPLRQSRELTEAYATFVADGYDSLFSAAEPEDWCLWEDTPRGLDSVNYDYRKRGRRQDADGRHRFLVETGSFYFTKTHVLRSEHNRLGGRIGTHIVPMWKSYEVDSLSGLEFCSLLMRHYGLSEESPCP